MKMNEIEINEKLMKEIGMEIFNYACSPNPKTYEAAEGIIARILSAVRNGKQKIPGEVGRGFFILGEPTKSAMAGGDFIHPNHEDFILGKDYNFIALSPRDPKGRREEEK